MMRVMTPAMLAGYHSAAARLGIPDDEYRAHRQVGESWCSGHKVWHPVKAFSPHAGRASGRASTCRAWDNARQGARRKLARSDRRLARRPLPPKAPPKPEWEKDSRYRLPVPPPAADTSWAELSAPGALEARINALRLEQADPVCAACGSSTPEGQPQQVWCPSCQQMLAVGCFGPHAARTTGRQYECRECARARRKAYRSRHALRALGIAS